MSDLQDGETIEMQGSGAKPHVLKNTGGVYSCKLCQAPMMVFLLFLGAPLVNAAEDDFNDNVVDPTKWNIVDSQFNAGRLAETNSRLEYLTVGIPTANDSSERIWVGGEVSYTNSW